MAEKRNRRLVPLFAALAVAAVGAGGYFLWWNSDAREKACYDEINADLEGTFEMAMTYAREEATPATTSLSKDDWLEVASSASNSQLAVALIYYDDHRNACEVYAYAGQLRRK